ncbi:ferredoxin family protein [Pseudonocardia ailaonensis]|uniref:Ferredoxin n=1 Tax=Pseudonocardia ailaonensis TaxID=367279 RepID=A0ABN2MUL4_9PSEU
MTYVVTGACTDVLDRACVDECPVDCIYEGASRMYINAEECVDCGACEPVCPVEAIYYEDDVPTAMAPFVGAATDFFARLGNPGGAANVGKQAYDCGPAAREG